MEVHVVGTHTFMETPASSVTGIARRERGGGRLVRGSNGGGFES